MRSGRRKGTRRCKREENQMEEGDQISDKKQAVFFTPCR